MNYHPALPLQKAIFEALANSPEIANAVTGVYDSVPDDAEFPYIAFASEAYTREIWGHEAFVDFLIVTEANKGRVQAKEISNLMAGILDYQNLDVEDFDVAEGGLYDQEFGIEENNESRLCVATYRFLLSAHENIFDEDDFG